jgi:hypothetical protein
MENLKSTADIVQVLAGLGLVTAALGYAKYRLERHHWEQFKGRINIWLDRQVELKERIADESRSEHDGSAATPITLRDDVLTIVIEKMLSDSGFTPLEVQQLFPTALLIVKASAADKFLI